jgi:hypothetical protein
MQKIIHNTHAASATLVEVSWQLISSASPEEAQGAGCGL